MLRTRYVYQNIHPQRKLTIMVTHGTEHKWRGVRNTGNESHIFSLFDNNLGLIKGELIGELTFLVKVTINI